MAERLESWNGVAERTTQDNERHATEDLLEKAHERRGEKETPQRRLGTEWSYRRSAEFQVASAKYFKRKRHEGKA